MGNKDRVRHADKTKPARSMMEKRQAKRVRRQAIPTGKRRRRTDATTRANR
jgi:hypothetical protein